MSTLAIRGGRVIDQTGDRVADVVIEDGIIAAIGPDLAGDRELDASGCVVSSGLVDLGTCVTEPGTDDIESLAQTCRAAELGGYTALVTSPLSFPLDSAEAIDAFVVAGSRRGGTQLVPLGAATLGGRSERMAPLGELAGVGVSCVGDPWGIRSDELTMRRVLEYSSSLALTFFDRPLHNLLAANGHIHEGEWSSRLGIAGQPSDAEELAVMADIALARTTGSAVHLLMLSTAAGVAMVQNAQATKVPVSCSVSAAHLVLDHSALAHLNPAMKLDPPLRTSADRDALVAGVSSGVVNAIVSGHRPCDPNSKDGAFDQSEIGAQGLETALALAIEATNGDMETVLAATSWNPAEIAGIDHSHGGTLATGRPANLCVIDPEAKWTADASAFTAPGAASPVHGRPMVGRVRHTICRGDAVVIDGASLNPQEES